MKVLIKGLREEYDRLVEVEDLYRGMIEITENKRKIFRPIILQIAENLTFQKLDELICKLRDHDWVSDIYEESDELRTWQVCSRCGQKRVKLHVMPGPFASGGPREARGGVS